MGSNKYRFVVCLFCLCICLGLNAQHIVKGYVLSASTNEPLPYVNITQYPSGHRFISNKFGAFSIQAMQGDTVLFSIIGFEPTRVAMPPYVPNNTGDIIKIYLKPITYKLNAVDIRSRKRNDSLLKYYAGILKTDSLLNNYNKIKYWPKSAKLSLSSGIKLEGLITAAWDKYSLRGKEISYTLRLIDLYRLQQKADEKYDKAFVKKITGLNDDLLDSFMNQCKLSDLFIINASEYELGLAIKHCLADFRLH